MPPVSCKRPRFPPDVIRPAARLYFRWVPARNESTFAGVIKSMPVSTRCGIGTPSDACHSIRMDIEPCIAGIVAADDSSIPALTASRIGLIPSIPTTVTSPILPALLIAAAMPIGPAASQHR
jgi:hypothetical protein